MEPDKKIKKKGRVFDTIADVGSLLLALVYILYVALLLIFDMGQAWLNHCMMGITILYVAFFVAKMMALNRIFACPNTKRVTRLTLKYSKWAMKLINATFVVLSVLTAHSEDNQMIMMVGVFVVLITFTISIIWDIAWFIIRRKFRDMWVGWDKLTREEKNKRIDDMINSFVNNIDALAGVNLAESLSNRRIDNAKELTKESKKDE